MRKIAHLLPAATIIFILWGGAYGCSEKPRANITRLDTIVMDYGRHPGHEADSVLGPVATPMGDYLYMMGLRSGSLQSSMDTLSRSAAFAMFYPEVERCFADMDSLRLSLGHLNRSLAGMFPTLPSPVYYGVISPYRQQVMIVDSLTFIALNHYLGAGSPAYEGMPDYVRREKTPGRIPYDVAEAVISVSHPYADATDATTLTRLLYEGALAHAVINSVKDADLRQYLGWDEEQWQTALKREGAWWQRLASADFLYSTDPAVARRLMDPAPVTSLLDADAPGRAGRFIGYRIVESYLNAHPGIPDSLLLAPAFYSSPRTLVDASYAPR